MQIQALLNGWAFRGFVNCTLNALIGVNLFVAVWGDATTPIQRAMYMVIADAVGVAWAAFGENKALRSWIMNHYTALLWGMCLADMFLWPIYLKNPYVYLIIFTVLFDGMWGLMFMTMTNEVREALITDPNKRNSFSARMSKVKGAGCVVGGLLSMVIPICEWGPWAMIGGFIVCGFGCAAMTTCVFGKTLKYMKAEGLEFHCCKPEAE